MLNDAVGFEKFLLPQDILTYGVGLTA